MPHTIDNDHSSSHTTTPTMPHQRANARAILPSPPSPSGSEFDPNSAPAPSPAKRGRKPGPLSRAARETQRKLNHSIIEKARRTKINEALASLRQLVPADYGQELEDDEDDEGEKKKKKGGKREEKEKEFKLEILVRTVSFLQDLVGRVQDLEERAVCTKCSESTLKRKHSIDDLPSSKRSKTDESRPLPPISSWLPTEHIDPQLLDSPAQFSLPSPPSSTQFQPQNHTPSVPTLHLGASSLPTTSPATSYRTPLLSPRRTPEDESAASLLLQISAASPVIRPTVSQPPRIHDTPAPLQAQTPGSMLGLSRG